MVYRDRQGGMTSATGAPPADPMSNSNPRDQYFDNCFLLCLNRDDQTDLPEIHRLGNHLLRDSCQGQTRRMPSDQRSTGETNIDPNEYDDYYDPEPHSTSRYQRRDHPTDYYP